MIYIILAWLFWFIFCSNIGFFVLRIALKEKYKTIDIFYNFWFGLFCLIALLGFISLFFPLNGTILIYLTIINVLMMIANIRSLNPNLKNVLKKIHKYIDIKIILIFIFLALLVSMISNLPVTWYDSLLYHLGSVKWLTEFGSVRGLANTYFPLGYNNATFTLAAIMDNGIFTNSSSHIVNSLLYIVFAFQIIIFLFKKKNNNLAFVFGFFCLYILSTFTGQLHSLSTDLGLAVFVLLFSFYVITFSKEDLILTLPILSLAAITKFSYFTVLILFSIFTLLVFKKTIFQKKNLIILLFVFVFFASYIARNLILSGWAFYPLQLFGFNFPWSVPSEQIKLVNDGLKAWGRLPGEHYMSSLHVGFWEWFRPWFNNNKANNLMYYSFALIPLLFAYIFYGRKNNKEFSLIGSISKIDLLIFANLVTLLYSFYASPDFRYMGIFILVSGALILSTLLTGVVKSENLKTIMILIFIFLISSNIFKVISFEGKKFNIQKEEGAQVESVRMKYSDQTFNVFVPVEGDRCRNSELPCVPGASGFKMFEPGNIKAGFFFSKSSEML